MIYKQYKFKFYLNARHAIYTDGVLGKPHTHSWEFVLHIVKGRTEFNQFSIIDKTVQDFFAPYQDRYLNSIPPFDVINPTLENTADYFRTALSERLNSIGWMLIMLEVSETPARTYVISLLDDIELSENQAADAVSNLILDRVRKSDKMKSEE